MRYHELYGYAISRTIWLPFNIYSAANGHLNKLLGRYGQVMTVEKIMSKSVVTVEMDDSLKVVKEIFDNTDFHHVLVVESGKLIGVISDRDLLKALSPNIGTIAETSKDALILNKKAHQIMTRKPVTLVPNSGIYDAVKIFNNNNISCIPVVDDEHKLVGLISWRDILKVLESNQGKPPNKTNQ